VSGLLGGGGVVLGGGVAGTAGVMPPASTEEVMLLVPVPPPLLPLGMGLGGGRPNRVLMMLLSPLRGGMTVGGALRAGWSRGVGDGQLRRLKSHWARALPAISASSAMTSGARWLRGMAYRRAPGELPLLSDSDQLPLGPSLHNCPRDRRAAGDRCKSPRGRAGRSCAHGRWCVSLARCQPLSCSK
jgi:hypothetical protein